MEVESLLKFLNTEEQAKLWNVIFEYVKTKKVVSDTDNLKNVFEIIKPRLDKQMEKAEIRAETARANGATGGRPPKKKTKKNPVITQYNPKEPTGLLIPDFIDAELWNGFLEMRIKAKAKPTENAIKLIIKDLEKFEGKKIGNANIALEQSIKNNWKGVFEPKETHSKSNTQELFTNLKSKYENETN